VGRHLAADGLRLLGFVSFVYGTGVDLPRTTYSSSARAARLARGLRPGDLVFFDGVGHVGLYVGHGRFIHAPHAGARVKSRASDGWYGHVRRCTTALDAAAAAAQGGASTPDPGRLALRPARLA
jgi:hypothetical protein